MISRDYDDVPGTDVLDSRSYRKGYHLNMFCMSLNKAECREEFSRDEMAYLQKFPMTDEQRQNEAAVIQMVDDLVHGYADSAAERSALIEFRDAQLMQIARDRREANNRRKALHAKKVEQRRLKPHAEAAAMDPQQRMLLELGYAALHGAGMVRSTLLGSITAVNTGQWASEFANVLAGTAAGRSVRGVAKASPSDWPLRHLAIIDRLGRAGVLRPRGGGPEARERQERGLGGPAADA